jgi:hypothetical protein
MKFHLIDILHYFQLIFILKKNKNQNVHSHNETHNSPAAEATASQSFQQLSCFKGSAVLCGSNGLFLSVIKANSIE